MQPSVVSLEALKQFEFKDHSFDPASGTLNLRWRWLGNESAIDLQESFQFPLSGNQSGPLSEQRLKALKPAFDLLHWIAGISYWKVRCEGSINFSGQRPDAWQSDALSSIYQNGLAELAWRNQLEGQYWPGFSGLNNSNDSDRDVLATKPAGLSKQVLLALGGGKDSLVALERLRSAGFDPITVQVGSAALIGKTAKAAGTEHRVITRTLSPELKKLNEAGAVNGHVPITAINSAVLILAAILWDCDAVVFANERSADSPTLVHEGRSINHQFAKSFEFEQLLSDWIERYIADDLRVFSILRRDSELAVCQEFAGLTQYHAVFSSCNRNFHLDGPRTERWCGHCPKCLFVYLALAGFMLPSEMNAMFGQDLLNDSTLIPGFEALLELEGHRPFECVGEADEARAALKLLIQSEHWQAHAVVTALWQKMIKHPVNVDQIDIQKLLQPAGRDRIPSEFLA